MMDIADGTLGHQIKVALNHSWGFQRAWEVLIWALIYAGSEWPFDTIPPENVSLYLMDLSSFAATYCGLDVHFVSIN